MNRQPFHSDGEDVLDARLNAWATGESHDPESTSELADDALAFHQWAASAYRHELATSGPGATTWSSVVARSKERKHTMNSVSIDTFVRSHAPGDQRQRPVKQYLNTAAMIVIVIGVALGGVFAALQINNGGNDSRFAMLPATPTVGEQTCDVEPMTVEELVAIAEEPREALIPGFIEKQLTNEDGQLPWLDEDYLVVKPAVAPGRFPADATAMTQSELSSVMPVANAFFACVQNGTTAQLLRLVDPVSIQQMVVAEFPFYRTEEQVSAYFEEVLASDLFSLSVGDASEGESALSLWPSQVPEHSRILNDTNLGMGYTRIVFVGTELRDSDGVVISRRDASGRWVEGNDQRHPSGIHAFVYNRYTKQWYVDINPGAWGLFHGD